MNDADNGILWLFGFVILFMVGISLWAAYDGENGRGEGYSEGEQAGIVQSFALKNNSYSTWEGELYVGMTPGSSNKIVPRIVYFSLPKDANKGLLETIKMAHLSGKKIRIKYDEWRRAPARLGTSEYIVKGATVALNVEEDKQ